MRRPSSLKILCLSMSLIGQSSFAYIYPQTASAIDLDSMIKEGIKNQLPGANQQNNNNQFTGATQQSPIKVDRGVQKLEDLIPKQDIPYGFAPMIPLQGITIAGLGPKAVAGLGENYFVVRNNTNVARMSDLYRENRSAGKANYVTIDCVLHPYLAFTNRINAELIKKHLLPITKSLLLAMLKVALSDYSQADDIEVKSDIESNVAFLSLALKLMDSAFAIPTIARVPQLVQADYDSVVFAKPGRSVIFDRNEDFSFYRPIGWYRSNPELFTFYRVKTWLSRMSYPINDVTYETGGVKANSFRRSVLLYRCLEQAKIDGKPAVDSWMKLVKGMFLLGSQVENWQEKNLYAHDYKSVFKVNSADLKMTLTALSEPLYRTKLLLAVRKQKPLTLGSTSIFDLEEARATKEVVASFKFIPSIGAPEEPWLRYAAALYPAPKLSTNVFPVALLDLNAWGAPQAGNSLLDSSWAMDDSMPKTVSELKRWVLRRALGGQVQPIDCRIWTILSPGWRLLPDGVQTALRGQMWATRRLETVFSAWLDSQVAIAPENYSSARTADGSSVSTEQSGSDSSNSEEKLDEAFASGASAGPATAIGGTKSGAKSGTTSTTSKSNLSSRSNGGGANSNSSSGSTKTSSGQNSISRLRTGASNPLQGNATATTSIANKPVASGASGSTRASGTTEPAVEKKTKPGVARRSAHGHFLDPCPDVYNRLLVDTQRIDKDLTALGFPLDANYKRGLDDFTRLFQRFFKISKDELEGKPLGMEDLNLLGNIDVILDKIDLPLPAVVPVEPLANFTTAKTLAARDASAGFTMALGRPGLLYVILLNRTTKEWTLARGSVYTYYEQYGSTLTEEDLLSRIDKGTIQPPYWAEHFDFIQADKK